MDERKTRTRVLEIGSEKVLPSVGKKLGNSAINFGRSRGIERSPHLLAKKLDEQICRGDRLCDSSFQTRSSEMAETPDMSVMGHAVTMASLFRC